MNRYAIPFAAALLWTGVGCSDDPSSKPTTDADTLTASDVLNDATAPADALTDATAPQDVQTDATANPDTLAGDTSPLIDIDTTPPSGSCGEGDNLARREALLAAQPALEARAKSVIAGTISWASLDADPNLTCSIELAFKDLNGNGSLDAYENWTLTPAERAADLVGRMSAAEKAGLLLHPTLADAPTASKPDVAATTATLATASHVRFGRTAADKAPITARATWANNLQELCEASAHGVPFALSMAPAHMAGDGRVKAAGFSRWPHELSLAAGQDPAVVKTFGQVVAQEYRAIGVRLALSPSADLATDPRWPLAPFTFGEDATQVSAMVSAYLEGLQGATLGASSVAAVVGHFPGAGAAKGGVDGRLAKGKFLAYPAKALDTHLAPFEAAFAAGAAAVMPAYGVPEAGAWTALGGVLDGASIEQVGASFNADLLGDALRGHYAFDGLVLAPEGVLDDAGGTALGAPWGVEALTPAARLAKAVAAGVDQFAGLADPALVTAAALPAADLDRAAAHALTLMFTLGLFEDPYVDTAAAPALVNTDPSYRAGLNAMNRGMVLLHNANKPAGWLNGDGDGTQSGDKGNAGNGSGKVLPAPPGEPYVSAGCSFFVMGDFDLDYVRSVSNGYGELTNDATAIDDVPVSTAAERIARSDYVFIRIAAPYTYDADSGDLGYPTPSLEYAGGENASELDDLAFARQAINALPSSKTQIVVGVDAGRPVVLSEVMGYGVSGLYIGWSVTDKVWLDVAFGIVKGVGRLPVGLAASNAAAAAQQEDQAGDGAHATFVKGHGLDTSTF